MLMKTDLTTILRATGRPETAESLELARKLAGKDSYDCMTVYVGIMEDLMEDGDYWISDRISEEWRYGVRV